MQTIAIPIKVTSAESLFNRGTLISLFLFFNFMVTYRVLIVSPVPELELVLELLYEGILVMYVVYRILLRIHTRNSRLNALEIYLGILLFIPLLAGFAAMREFGQPLLYGIGTYRDWYLLYGALVLYNMIRTGTATLEQVERMFLFTAWFTITMYYAMSLLTNPNEHLEGALAGSNSAKGGEAYYRFNMTFIFFGSLYYLVKAFYQKNFKYLIFGLIFLIYIVFFRFDRTSIAVLIAAILAFYFTALTPKRQVMWIMLGIIPLFALLIIGAILAPEVYVQYYLMFEDAFLTLFGSYSAEQEESVRVDELRIALEGISKHPFIGNGKVSGQWVEGGFNYFYDFFYVSDVGIFGQIFLYGFIGAGIIYGQFALLYYYAFKIKHIKRNAFLVSLKFFALALMLDTITQGYLTIYSAQTITILAIVYAFYEKDRILGVRLRADDLTRHENKGLEEGSAPAG
jgi:hypothetical protein